MIELLARLLRAIGAQAMIAFALLAIILGSVVLGVSSVIRGLNLELVSSVTLMAMLGGWLLARLPFPGWLASAILALFGSEIILMRVGQLEGKLFGIARTLIELTMQAVQRKNILPLLISLENASGELLGVVAALIVRLGDGLVALMTGVPAYDPIVSALVWSAAFWAIAAWAAWGVRRRAQVFSALVPGIAMLTIVLGYARGDANYLILPLAAALIAMTFVSSAFRERVWRIARVDFAQDLASDQMMLAVPLTIGLVAAAWIAPSISVRDWVETAQGWLRQQTEIARAPESLGLQPRPYEPNVFDVIGAGGLPRQHLIGASPELLQSIALIVRTDDTRPGSPGNASPPAYYWRSATYDIYTGRGWNSYYRDIAAYEANAQLFSEPPPFQRKVRQNIEFDHELGGLLFAAGNVSSVDRDFRVAWREPNDIFGAELSAKNYRAESYVPTATEAQLRAAGTNYPETVKARYLELPEDLPPRVRTLALDVTLKELTPYDRARAIEKYLRQFAYTTDLAAPPPNRDVVDYFLFDLKRGYCDYFASAMVVLARAAGLPARLGVGYASGAFDAASAEYIVRGVDAHSWVEIYFPRYGWVEFEPTSNRATVNHALPPLEESPTQDAAKAAPSTSGAFEWRWWLIVSGGIALLALAAGAILGADAWRLQHLAPSSAIANIYARLEQHAQRIGVPVRTSDTPNELAAKMIARVANIAPKHAGAEETRALTRMYVEMRYGARSPNDAARRDALLLWSGLNRELWRVWMEKQWGRVGGK
jgi:hypothetical protein